MENERRTKRHEKILYYTRLKIYKNSNINSWVSRKMVISVKSWCMCSAS
jgi:hypothetical protein